jgi:hypothetical protein
MEAICSSSTTSRRYIPQSGPLFAYPKL